MSFISLPVQVPGAAHGGTTPWESTGAVVPPTRMDGRKTNHCGWIFFGLVLKELAEVGGVATIIRTNPRVVAEIADELAFGVNAWVAVEAGW